MTIRPMSASARQQMTEPSEGTGPRRPGGFACYKDCVGVVTGGYGHTARAGAPIPILGDVWSQDKSDAVLGADLARWSAMLAPAFDRAALKRQVQQREVDAITDLFHNCGNAILSSTLLRLYVGGAPAGEVAAHFADWDRAGGKIVSGLVTRRAHNRAWFLTGRLADTAVAGLLSVDEPMAHVLDHPDGWLAQMFNAWRIGA